MISAKNIKIFLNYWLGPIIFLWLTWAIYNQVISQPDLPQAWNNIKTSLKSGGLSRIIAVIVLMIVNWGIEAVKWRELLRPLHRLSLWRALKATLAGVAFAVNTPNRIGEYGGRVLYLPDDKRLQAVSLTLIGSFSQLLVTMMAGTAGLWLLYFGALEIHPPVYWSSNALWIRVLCLVLSTTTILLLLVYLRISWLVRLFERLPGVDKWGRSLLVIDHLPVRILLRVLGWSMIRYTVFVIQYILLLQSFEVTSLIWVSSWMISVQFLMLAVIPTIALAELGLRGQLALELFGWISTNTLGIVTASIALWLINLVTPALIGSLLIIRIKIFNPVNKKDTPVGEIPKNEI